MYDFNVVPSLQIAYLILCTQLYITMSHAHTMHCLRLPNYQLDGRPARCFFGPTSLLSEKLNLYFVAIVCVNDSFYVQ